MALTFQHEVNMVSGSTPMAIHEPNNELVVYYEYINAALNRVALPVLGIYDNLELTEQPTRLTKTKISSYGVKSSVGIGSYGFFVDEKGENTYVKIPIRQVSGTTPPTFSVDQTDLTITYTIGNPDLIMYENFRMIFRQGHFAYEFITHDIEGEVEKPFGMYGDFAVTCTGYKNEIQDYSQPTPQINITITKRSDDVEESAADSATVLLEAVEWDLNMVTVEVEGVTPTSIVIVAPSPVSQEAYTFYGVLCIEQGDGTLTFKCATKPIADINIGVVIL